MAPLNVTPSASTSTTPSTRLRGDVAIIGMACLFPGAPNLDAYWQNIVSGVDATTDAPAEAWDENIFYDPDSTATDRVYCKRGGYLGPIARFNPLAHGIMPLAVEGGEPDQWLALQLAHDALADAGYADRPRERERTAVILGKGTYINRGNLSLIQHGLMVEQIIQILRSLHPEYGEHDFEAIRAELKNSLPPLDTNTASALIPNVIAGRIANRLDLMGPSYTVDGACASSLLAVEIAMRDLLTGQCDLALVGGSQVTTPIPILTLFCQLNALSHRQQLRAFDAAADGTVLGEGIGMVVLKRREDAERDGDRIYAVIKGVGSASDGRAVSVMAPRVEGEILALRRAYEMAGVTPDSVALIEAHGTGTPVGDVVELQALAAVFGPRAGAYPHCALGSVKSMIGHTMPAAGIAGLIKAALALYHKTLPPTLHCDTPNPALELDQTSFYINTETRPWIHGTSESPRRAGVNAFGFGGINAHVVLEEHTAVGSRPAVTDGDPKEATACVDVARSHHLYWDSETCILRAHSREGLLQRIEGVQDYLAQDPECRLKDLAYTLNVTTPDAPWRLALVATSIADLQEKLGRAQQRLSDPECKAIKDVRGIYFAAQPLGPEGKLAFLFPGEGSQYVNMLADLCVQFPEVRACFDRTDRVYLDHARGYLPSDVIFPRPGFSKEERAAAAQRLWQMDSAIEAILTANHALFTLLRHLDLRPDVLLGHSSGEYSALWASGAINLGDEAVYAGFLQALNRTYEHEAAQDGVPRAALMVIGADRAQVSSIVAQVDSQLYVAMDHCPHQTVVAGTEAAIARAAELARARGLIHQLLPFDRPYHTPLFETYADGLRRIYADLPVTTPGIETYSCTRIGPFPSEPAAIRALALEHWVKPVEFSSTIEAMYEAGVRVFVEAGPKGNLTAFIEDILGDRPYLAVPANLSRRSGISGLNHMVALLAAHGVPMALEYLYQRRAPQTLPIDAGDAAQPRRDSGTRKLATGWPPLSLSSELTKRLREKAQQPSQRASMDVESRERFDGFAGSPGAVPPVPTSDAPGAVPQHAPPDIPLPPIVAIAALEDDGARTGPGPEAEPTTAQPPVLPPVAQQPVIPTGVPVAAQSGVARRGLPPRVMHAYLHTMDQFVLMQEQLMQSYVRAAHARRTTRRTVDAGQDLSNGDARPAGTGTVDKGGAR